MLSVNRDRDSTADVNANSNSNATDSILNHPQRINRNSHHTDDDDDNNNISMNISDDIDSDMCVWAHDLKRKQGKTMILKGISLSLPKGKIYGLLGPSGCGKTTFLNCVLGRLKPTSGDIRVFGMVPYSPQSQVPGIDVGYMPQSESALYPEFTIDEHLKYYAKLSHIPSKSYTRRRDELLSFLELPAADRVVQTLSGGQKRRVSLAIALLHRPRLLLLDEPTVGVDPLLRAKIWAYLVRIARSGTSVMITTHYIEEARQADVVGFMRTGIMLEEGSPDELIHKYNTESLEDTFLQLCNQHSKDGKSPQAGMEEDDTPTYTQNNKRNNNTATNNRTDTNTETKQESTRTTSQSHTLAVPSSSLTQRRPQTSHSPQAGAGTGTTSGMADDGLHTPLLDNMMAENGNKADFVTDSELDIEPPTPSGASFLPRPFMVYALVWKQLQRLRHSLAFLLFQFLLPSIQVALFCVAIGGAPRGLHVGVVNLDSAVAVPFTNETVSLGDVFISELEKQSFALNYYDNQDDAYNAIRKGSSWCYVYIPHNYTSAMVLRAAEPLYPSRDVVENSTITYRMDATNEQINVFVDQGIVDAYSGLLQTIGSWLNATVSYPLQQAEPVYGNINAKFTDFVAPGIIITIAFSQAIGLTAVSFVIDKKTGNLDRTFASGVRAAEIMCSQIITYMIILGVEIGLLLIVALTIFKIPMEGSVALVFFLCMFLGMTGMMYGLIIASLCEEESQAMQLALGSFFPALLLSGVIWPVEAIPIPLNYVSLALPTTHAANSVRSIMGRGWGMDHEDVWLGFVVASAWIAVFFVVAARGLKSQT